ncbi:hypothetical protein BDQ17DRAFT_1500234 [Cyathus striatus]|nr:hypothetical protein BDQ17DRAFT_1500234 [Cyathus striatus]
MDELFKDIEKKIWNIGIMLQHEQRSSLGQLKNVFEKCINYNSDSQLEIVQKFLYENSDIPPGDPQWEFFKSQAHSQYNLSTALGSGNQDTYVTLPLGNQLKAEEEDIRKAFKDLSDNLQNPKLKERLEYASKDLLQQIRDTAKEIIWTDPTSNLAMYWNTHALDQRTWLMKGGGFLKISTTTYEKLGSPKNLYTALKAARNWSVIDFDISDEYKHFICPEEIANVIRVIGSVTGVCPNELASNEDIARALKENVDGIIASQDLYLYDHTKASVNADHPDQSYLVYRLNSGSPKIQVKFRVQDRERAYILKLKNFFSTEEGTINITLNNKKINPLAQFIKSKSLKFDYGTLEEIDITLPKARLNTDPEINVLEFIPEADKREAEYWLSDVSVDNHIDAPALLETRWGDFGAYKSYINL